MLIVQTVEAGSPSDEVVGVEHKTETGEERIDSITGTTTVRTHSIKY